MIAIAFALFFVTVEFTTVASSGDVTSAMPPPRDVACALPTMLWIELPLIVEV